MLSEFIGKKLQSAQYKILKDGTFFGEIAGAKGVWANVANLEDCRADLREVLEEWILLKVRSGDKIPGFKLRVDRRELVKHA
jgi:predicted RNase H-like HicB family nuclease